MGRLANKVINKISKNIILERGEGRGKYNKSENIKS